MTERDGPHDERFKHRPARLGYRAATGPTVCRSAVRRRRTAASGCQSVIRRLAAGRSAHSLDIAGRIGGTVRPGGLALAPNGREPGLLMPRPPRRAVVVVHLHEPGRGDVIAPRVKIEETGIATIAQAFLVVPPRI